MSAPPKRRQTISCARIGLLKGLNTGGVIKTGAGFSYPTWNPAGTSYEGTPSCQTVRAAHAAKHIEEIKERTVMHPGIFFDMFYRITEAGKEAIRGL